MKIVWAVDPFLAEKSGIRSAAWCLRSLAAFESAEVHPIYVLASPRGVSPLADIQINGQRRLAPILARAKLKATKALEVLPGNSMTVRGQAQELLARAEALDADLVVASTHGRKWVRRWVLGSFAETLMLHARIPVLLAPAQRQRAPDLKKILFPTDFSDESRAAFERVLEFALRYHSKVTLFHKVRFIVYPAFDFGAAYYAAYSQALGEEVSAAEKRAEEWVSHATDRGVSIDKVFDRSRFGTPVEAILKRAKRSGGLIALASASGPVSAVLLGSTTREVSRGAEQPVWVIHPDRKAIAVHQDKPGGSEPRVEPLRRGESDTPRPATGQG